MYRRGFLLALMFAVAGCGTTQMSVTGTGPVQTVSRLAIAPGSGVFGDALAVELFNSGLTIIDANQATTLVGRAGLSDFEITSTAGYSALQQSGIDAVLTVRSVDAEDGTPESASIRVNSTADGSVLAGVTWQNGWGGQRGSIADRTMRKNLSDATRDIAAEIMTRIKAP
ncbi:hypothetical protein PHACT_10120 [Pseudohongiella acticola]|uniref:Curli production assembly/transport component CsgG n=1 Tax=Pseudohongiella acticola TaxID=1524254 RepID=A0A1E8CMG0_9GAMM|nr:hypothetical protein PHACT_10120 [Pseudohongiella acticola]